MTLHAYVDILRYSCFSLKPLQGVTCERPDGPLFNYGQPKNDSQLGKRGIPNGINIYDSNYTLGEMSFKWTYDRPNY